MSSGSIYVFAVLSAICVFVGSAFAAHEIKARPAAVAGMFYPADPTELAKSVDAMLAKSTADPIQGRLWAIISPHAGYPYSGGVAASAYAQLKGRAFRRVVVIAPSHYESFPFVSIYDGDVYATPLGSIRVDKSFAAKLAASGGVLQLSDRGHLPSKERREHAIEVELPFLQRALSDFQLVPIVMGDQSYQASRALGVALASLIRDTDTLIVASSDLSHYHSYDEATGMDRKLLRSVRGWDYLSLSRNTALGVWEACGAGPVVATMIAAERLGASDARILEYANSGDVTPDRARVVGYAAAALLQPPSHQRPEMTPYSLNSHEKKTLLDVAHKAVETAVRRESIADVAKDAAALNEERGAFVTLTTKGNLRGCIGYVSSFRPLAATVQEVAIAAALHDPRFPPVSRTELEDLEYEISVLSPFRRVTDINEIRIGRDGLLLKNGDREGVLLPQVPVQQHWNRKTFLQQVSLKAGLAPDAWQDANTDLFMFNALVFGDRVPASEQDEGWKQPRAMPPPGPPDSGPR